MQTIKKYRRITAAITVFLLIGLSLKASHEEEQAKDADKPKVVADILRQDIPSESQTQILILGTSHLRQIDQQFKPEMLDSLIAVLTYYDPDAR